jgi:hypothetical protein
VWREEQIHVDAHFAYKGTHFIEVAVRVADAIRPVILGDLAKEQIKPGR